jgi:hypothetical protein
VNKVEECGVRDPRYTASVLCTLTRGHEGFHYDFENPGLGMWPVPTAPDVREESKCAQRTWT